MEQAKIDRINALAKKAKSPEGLTPEETAERGRTVCFRGRGYAARLLDNESPPMSYQGVTLREILRRQGGYVKVASRPGQGTTFSLYLPRE